MGGAVTRARLDGNRLTDSKVIWRQEPKTVGRGHFGHRLVFGRDGTLFITSGERMRFDPAQSLTSNLGKVVRINRDGSIPKDNPFVGQAGCARRDLEPGTPQHARGRDQPADRPTLGRGDGTARRRRAESHRARRQLRLADRERWRQLRQVADSRSPHEARVQDGGPHVDAGDLALRRAVLRRIAVSMARAASSSAVSRRRR